MCVCTCVLIAALIIFADFETMDGSSIQASVHHL